jgi:Centromere DNA-binding protein complex CBF3 subunit, domain 2/Transcriptional activator of glycolytic enzymes
VTPDKLAAWLNEDILLRRVKVPIARRGPRPRSAAAQLRREQADAAALLEAKSLAAALEVPLAEAAELLIDDREGYVPPAALAPLGEAVEAAAEAAAEAEGTLLTRGTVDAYIAAVIELWRVQVAHGSHNTDNPRGAAVRGFLEQRGRQRGRLDRDTFQDRGKEGIQAGYSSEEWLRIQDLLLRGAALLPQNLRTRVDLLFGHYYLLRGENRRKMELADLSLLDYPASEGPTPCSCLVSLLQDGKLNKTARKEFMGALRHRDPLLCTQGALAQLLFWRWHVAGEAPPSFQCRQDWYRIKVLVGQDRKQEISYATQLQDTWRIFGTAGLVSAKKTHLPRRVGAQDAETHGTSLAQISQAGRWNQSVLVKAYLTHLPRQFMRVVAGFSGAAGDYFLPRAAHEPPQHLQKQLWPWIEEWEPRFEARACRQGWAQGGLDEDDLAADGFLKLLRRLRAVLLQDLAVLQPRYPSLPFFAHAPFRGPDWDAFAHAVQADATAAEPQSVLLQRALPELSAVLESTREAVLHNSTRLASQLEGQLGGLQGSLESRLGSLQGSLDALLQGRVPITLTGYFGAPPQQGPAPLQGPALASASTSVGALTASPPVLGPAIVPKPSPPVYTALAKAYTVADAWREWKEGLAGQPAIRELEEAWGSRWRPSNTVRVQFCRRKVIWDAVQARVARGGSEEEAIAELELLRAGRSLNQLVDELKHRRQHQRARGPPIARGQGWTGRWQLFGRRGGPSRQAIAT